MARLEREMAKGVYTGRDRRSSVRFRFDAAVMVEHDGARFEARGTDFNDDSVGVVHSAPLPIGAIVRLRVVDELGNEIELGGEVVRADPVAGGEGFAMVIKRIPPGGA